MEEQLPDEYRIIPWLCAFGCACVAAIQASAGHLWSAALFGSLGVLYAVGAKFYNKPRCAASWVVASAAAVVVIIASVGWFVYER